MTHNEATNRTLLREALDALRLSDPERPIWNPGGLLARIDAALAQPSEVQHER